MTSAERLLGWKELPMGALPIKFSTEYKTGDWRSFRPVIDDKKCIKCLICELFCPEMAIKVEWEGARPKKVTVDYNYCKGCGICAAECPVKAIKMEPEG